MPPNEELAELARHGTTMALFLSVRRPRELQAELIEGGYAPATPCAVVYRATWPDEIVLRCALSELAQTIRGGEDHHAGARHPRPRARRRGGRGALARLRPRLRPPLPPARPPGPVHAQAGMERAESRLESRSGTPRSAGVIAVLGVAGGRVPAGTEALLARADVVAGGRRLLAALAPPPAPAGRARQGARGGARRPRGDEPATCACWLAATRASSGSCARWRRGGRRTARRATRAVVGGARLRAARPGVGRRARRLRPRPRAAAGDGTPPCATRRSRSSPPRQRRRASSPRSTARRVTVRRSPGHPRRAPGATNRPSRSPTS